MTSTHEETLGLNFTPIPRLSSGNGSGMRGAPPKSRAREWLAISSLGIYAVVILYVTLTPTPLDQGFESSVTRFLNVLHRNGIPEWFGYNKLEFSANVVMFVPLGFLVSMLLPVRLWWLALFICPGISGAIELTQGALLAGRFATLNDVYANSMGGFIGAIVAFAIRAAVYQRDEKVIARAIWMSRQPRQGKSAR